VSINVYYDKDADLSIIQSKKVVILGYGSQGHAHAQNLKDSGVDVTVGLRKGSKSWAKAEGAGLKVKEVAEAVKGADLVMILAPDQDQRKIYEDSIAANLKQGGTLAFAHGFNIHFQLIEPRADLDVIMVAPKGPGHLVRSTYTQGGGVPSLICVHQDASGQAKQIAQRHLELGCQRLQDFQQTAFQADAGLCAGHLFHGPMVPRYLGTMVTKYQAQGPVRGEGCSSPRRGISGAPLCHWCPPLPVGHLTSSPRARSGPVSGDL